MRRTIRRAVLAAALALPAAAAAATAAPAAPAKRPNILLVVADDLGFSDLGAFGGEIATPNLDAIARQGVRFTSFYTAPTCSPTRAMLLTGEDHHAVGMGTMAEALPATPALRGRPGYVGHLDPAIPTIAERLAAAGYRTMMAGKWHLGLKPEFDPAKRGFQQSFALLQGGSEHFGNDQDGQLGGLGASYTENGKPARFPVGRYTGDYFADRMIGFLAHGPAEHRPFFAYMAFTEPHWPLQAPDGLIDSFRGRYDDGPAVLRANRLKRMRALGLLDERTLGAKLETLQDWNALTPAQRAVASRAMEVYAAMVVSLDRNVGRLLAALRRSGELDNTVIVFLSDNGAEGLSQQEVDGLITGRLGAPKATVQAMAAANSDPARIGRPGSYVAYGPQWAQAAMAPFHLYKGFTDDGGVRTPAFIAGPGVDGGRTVGSLTSVRDIVPTLLALAGAAPRPAAPPATGAGYALPEGKSLAPVLAGRASSVRGPRDMMAWELFFRRAIRVGSWKAVYREDEVSVLGGAPAAMRWHLFDLAHDPGESRDVGAAHPDVLKRLIDAWSAYARREGVFVPDAGQPK